MRSIATNTRKKPSKFDWKSGLSTNCRVSLLPIATSCLLKGKKNRKKFALWGCPKQKVDILALEKKGCFSFLVANDVLASLVAICPERVNQSALWDILGTFFPSCNAVILCLNTVFGVAIRHLD